MKLASWMVPTCVGVELPGCVTDTVPSLPMVMVSVLAGMVMVGCS